LVLVHCGAREWWTLCMLGEVITHDSARSSASGNEMFACSNSPCSADHKRYHANAAGVAPSASPNAA